MIVHICMLIQVYELLITQLHIFSINFIKALSYYRCIRYLLFLVLFMSISMVFIDILYYGRIHYFSGPCYLCYLQNNIKHSSLCL